MSRFISKRAITERAPYNGVPYYCNTCGLGYGEYVACEDGDCELESTAEAKLRQEKRRSKRLAVSAPAREEPPK